MGWTLITGAADRLGATLAKSIATAGHDVLIHWRSSEKLAHSVTEVCRGFGVQAEMVQGDFATLESTEKFTADVKEKFPDIKNLVNNVGNFLTKSALNTTPEEWINLFQTNLHAPFVITRELVETIKQSNGSIINIGVSGLQKCAADTEHTAYGVTKHGLWILTKSLAAELAGSNVRVNMVSPGQMEISINLPEDVCELPMQRAGKPSEIAHVINFLLDDQSEYITGQNIDVAGGYKL